MESHTHASWNFQFSEERIKLSAHFLLLLLLLLDLPFLSPSIGQANT